MRILGIDVGSSGVKAVELDSAFGRYEIHDYYEQKFAAGEDPVLAIARLMQSLPKQPDRVAVALPSRHVTFRNLKLPTKDRKVIQSTVGFEMDDELPFAIEKAAYDYTVISQTKQSSEVHVAATLNKHVSTLLSVWNNAGVEPDVVTTESWAYRSLLNRILSKADQQQPVMMADIGHERTVIYVHYRGAPLITREIAWGGRDLTASIARKYGLTTEEAEAAKLDHGFVVPESQKGEVTAEQALFSNSLMETLNELIIELRQTEFSCKSITHENPNRLLISGGTSLLPGLARTLEENLYIPVRPLQALSSIATSGVTYSEQTDASFLLAAALALSLTGDRATIINLRKGVFAKQGRGREISLAQFRRPLLAGGAIVLSLFLSLFIESRIYQSKIAEVDQQLERSMRTFFTGVSSSAIRSYLMDTAKLRKNINKELDRQRATAQLFSPNPQSPLEFLKTLSTSIPKDVVVDMTRFQVGAAPTSSYSAKAEQNMTVTFLVANPGTAERLSNILQGQAKVSGLQKGSVEEVSAPDGTGKRWKVTFTGKPTEEAYGK